MKQLFNAMIYKMQINHEGFQLIRPSHPPPLPQAGDGCDQRQRARTGPMQTDISWFDLLNCISASSSQENSEITSH